MSYLNFIQTTLQASATIARQNLGKVNSISVKTGDNNQVLTETDLEIGRLIVTAIRQAYPTHNIIDEEAGIIDNNSTTTWVVDPIDGTSNFSQGLPTYGIMIGVLEGAVPVAGGIVLPSFDELYLGANDTPATKNGQPITVSTKPTLLKSLVSYGIDGHQEDPVRTQKEAKLLGEIILAIRNLRTTNSAYDMAKMVEGKYGLFLNQTTKIWDNVAVQAVVEAAGGICTDIIGRPLDYSQPLSRVQQNYTICAGAPHLHQQIQVIIGKYA